jgi:hypothetical protein
MNSTIEQKPKTKVVLTSCIKLKCRTAFRTTWDSMAKTTEEVVMWGKQPIHCTRITQLDEDTALEKSIEKLFDKLKNQTLVRFSFGGEQEIVSIAEIERLYDFRLEVVDGL